MADKHRVSYDSTNDRVFDVHNDYGVVKDEQTPIGLNKISEENKLFYTAHQVAQAKQVCDKYLTGTDTPSVKDFKNVLPANFIQNCSVTPIWQRRLLVRI